MAKRISKKVPHTYIQHGVRFYAMLREIRTTNTAGEQISAYNFYVFDEEGYVWLQMLQITKGTIFSFGDGFFQSRTILEVDDPQWKMVPNVPSDAWIDGHADRGYALEIIREGLGLDLVYLKSVIGNAVSEESEEVDVQTY